MLFKKRSYPLLTSPSVVRRPFDQKHVGCNKLVQPYELILWLAQSRIRSCHTSSPCLPVQLSELILHAAQKTIRSPSQSYVSFDASGPFSGSGSSRSPGSSGSSWSSGSFDSVLHICYGCQHEYIYIRTCACVYIKCTVDAASGAAPAAAAAAA